MHIRMTFQAVPLENVAVASGQSNQLIIISIISDTQEEIYITTKCDRYYTLNFSYNFQHKRTASSFGSSHTWHMLPSTHYLHGDNKLYTSTKIIGYVSAIRRYFYSQYHTIDCKIYWYIVSIFCYGLARKRNEHIYFDHIEVNHFSIFKVFLPFFNDNINTCDLFFSNHVF